MNTAPEWLQQLGISSSALPFAHSAINIVLLITILIICHLLTHYKVVPMVIRLIDASTNRYDDLLVEHKVVKRGGGLIPLVVALWLLPIFFAEQSVATQGIETLLKVLLCWQIARCVSATLTLIRSLLLVSEQAGYLPINAAIQVLKLVVYLVAIILAVALVLDRSPLYLLSGLGALTAVLLLVFQDTIKGFVASIQISANRMVTIGDWIEMPQYGANGDVLEIGLNTVKVKNFDNTITTVPTYALINESFKNWRGMINSKGRRIKRALLIDTNSIHFCKQQELEKLSEIVLIKGYISDKLAEISQANNAMGFDSSDPANGRKLSNIGTFRAYVTAYLQNHPMVSKELTCMVRQLPATSTGLPLELYCFCTDQRWTYYEGIMADIFDHLYAMAPLFNLRIFQQPSGYDWQHATNAAESPLPAPLTPPTPLDG